MCGGEEVGSDDVASLWTNASAAYAELGEYVKAAEAAARAAESSPKWTKAYHRWSVALEKQGKMQDAMQVCKLGIARCGANAQMEARVEMLEAATAREALTREALKELGNASLRTGDNETAIEAYTRAIEKGSLSEETTDDALTVTLYNNRAEARRRLGEYEASAADCGRALELDGRNLKALIRRAGTYEELEKYKFACLDYEKALVIDPSDPYRVRQRLAKCRELVQ